MKKPRYSVKIKLAKKHPELEALISEIAEKYKLKSLEKNPQTYHLRTGFTRRHVGDAAVRELYNKLKEFVPRRKIRIDVENNDLLLEDLLNQAKKKASQHEELIIDNFVVSYLSPPYAYQLKTGKIKGYLDIERCSNCFMSDPKKMRLPRAIQRARKYISELEGHTEFGLLVSIEMLRNDLRAAYFGPFINLTGNYRTKLHTVIRAEPTSYSNKNAIGKHSTKICQLA